MRETGTPPGVTPELMLVWLVGCVVGGGVGAFIDGAEEPSLFLLTIAIVLLYVYPSKE